MSIVRLRLLRKTVALLASGLSRRAPPVSVKPLLIGTTPARLYTPPALRSGPAIIFFHGGGFISCGLGTHENLCRRLALASGLRVIAVAYRLAPEHPAPAQLEDAIAACRWVLEAPAETDGRAGQIIVSGDSAGGYLAVRCGLALGDQAESVAAQLLFYPFVGLDAQHAVKTPASLIERGTSALIQSCLGPETYPSLLSFDLQHLPKTIVIGGGLLDPVSASNKAFVNALVASNVTVEHVVLPRLFHGALNVDRLSRSAEKAIESSVRFLD